MRVGGAALGRRPPAALPNPSTPSPNLRRIDSATPSATSTSWTTRGASSRRRCCPRGPSWTRPPAARGEQAARGSGGESLSLRGRV